MSTSVSWWERAACRQEDPELFFPIGDGEASALQVAEAKRVCARCPVRTTCLAEAVAFPYLTGVWGGTTEEERYAERCRRLRANRQQVKTPPAR